MPPLRYSSIRITQHIRFGAQLAHLPYFSPVGRKNIAYTKTFCEISVNV